MCNSAEIPEKLIKSLELLKDWDIWMVSLTTAVLGGILVMLRESDKFESRFRSMRMLSCSLWSFVSSIAIATWALGAIPSVMQRLLPSQENVYEMNMFDWLAIPLWFPHFLLHGLFISGFVLFVSSLRLPKQLFLKKGQ